MSSTQQINLWVFTGIIIFMFGIVFYLISKPFKTNAYLGFASISAYLFTVAVLCVVFKPSPLEINKQAEPVSGKIYYLNMPSDTENGTLNTTSLDTSFVTVETLIDISQTNNYTIQVASFYTDIFYEKTDIYGKWVLEQYAYLKNDDYTITNKSIANYSFEIWNVNIDNTDLSLLGSSKSSTNIDSYDPTLYVATCKIDQKTTINANSKIRIDLFLNLSVDVPPTTSILSLFQNNYPSLIKSNYVITQPFPPLYATTAIAREIYDISGDLIETMYYISTENKDTDISYSVILDATKDTDYLIYSGLLPNLADNPLQIGNYTLTGKASVTDDVNVVKLKFILYIYEAGLLRDANQKTKLTESEYSNNVTSQTGETYSMSAPIDTEYMLSGDQQFMMELFVFNSGANNAASVNVDNATLTAVIDVDEYTSQEKPPLVSQDKNTNFLTKLSVFNMVLLSVMILIFVYFNFYKSLLSSTYTPWVVGGLFAASIVSNLFMYLHLCLTGYSFAMLVNIFAVFVLYFVALSIHVFNNPSLISNGAVTGIMFLFFVGVGLVSWKLLVDSALKGNMALNICVFVLGLLFMLFAAYKMFKSSVTEYLSPANYTLQQIDIVICMIKDNIPLLIALLAKNWMAVLALVVLIVILVYLQDIGHFFVFIWDSIVKGWNAFIDFFNFWPLFKRSKLFDFSHLFHINATIPKIQGTLFKALGAILLGGIMFVLSTVGAWAVGLGVAILAFLTYITSQIPVPTVNMPDVPLPDANMPDAPDVNMPDVNMPDVPDDNVAKYLMMALIVLLLAFGASISWIVAGLCAVVSALAYLVPTFVESQTVNNASKVIVAALVLVGFFLGGWAVTALAAATALISYGLSHIPEIKAWFAMVLNKILHLFPDQIFFPTKQKLNKETTLSVGKFSYRYAISFWVYLIPQPPNESPEANQFVNILSYGKKPAVLYNAANNILRIVMQSQAGKNIFITDVRDMKLQAWSNLVLNVDATLIDVFVNGKLYTSVSSVPAVGDTTLTMGEVKGNRGYIVGIRFLNNNGSSETITADQVRVLYETNVGKDPPTF